MFENAAINLAEKIKEAEIEKDLVKSLENIQGSGLFDDKYLKNIILVSFTKKEQHEFKGGKICRLNEDEEYDWNEFATGARTDFVAVNPKKDHENNMRAALREKKHLEAIFFNGPILFDEFIAHEMAHNVFDIEYKKRYGEYGEDEGGLTDVSDVYREKIKSIITSLIQKYYPNIQADKFPFNRQQIAEVFAFLYEREYCQKTNTNTKVHEGVVEKATEIGKDPVTAIKNFNEESRKNFDLDEFYGENHILSIIIAPILEKEYPTWEERKNIFWK